MRCNWDKSELAMLIGDDGDLEQRTAVRQHVDHCQECRVHVQRLRRSQQALQILQPAGEFPSDYRTVRSNVLNSLRTDQSSADVRRFNQLVASIALAAGLLAAVCISNTARLNSLDHSPVVVAPFWENAQPGLQAAPASRTAVSFPGRSGLDSVRESPGVSDARASDLLRRQRAIFSGF